MVGKHPAHFLHPGNQQHIAQENHHPDKSLNEIYPQVAGNPPVKQAADDHGKQEKEHNGQPQTHKHGNAHNGLLEGFVSQLLFQPPVKLGGLLLHFLRSQVRRAEKRLNAHHLGVEKVENTPDKGKIFPGFRRIFLSGHGLDVKIFLGAHNDGILVRAPHHNALDESLTADGGFEFFL